MSTTTTDRPVTRYAGFRRPKSVGLGDLSLPASLSFLGDLLVSILVYSYLPGWGKFLIAVQLVVFLLAVTVKDADGITVWSRIARRVRFFIYSITGITSYSAHLVKKKRLTGPLSECTLLEWETSSHEKFSLIHHPYAQQYALPLECFPNGGERHDQRHKDQQVANWGGFCAGLGNIPSVAQSVTVIESAPRTQAEARAQMEQFIRADAPATAREVTLERLSIGVEHHAANRTHEVITFNATAKGASKKARNTNALAIAQLLPTIRQQLSVSGAGAVRPLSERQCAEVMRAMIDPQARPFIEDAHAHGEDTQLTWDDCGPISMRPSYDYLLHDGAVSQTLLMTRAPAGAVTSDVLKQLLAPHPDIEIKRVAIIKQVIEVGRASVLTNRDLGNAELRREANRRSGAARLEEKVAQRTSDEHAEGHGLEDFTIAITVTVTDPQRLAHAVSTVRSQLGPGANIRFRPALGQQMEAFYLTTIAGLDPWAHSTSESITRNATAAH